jgi:transposase
MAKRLSMRKIAECLRLHFECGCSQRQIAEVIGASPTTVGDYLRRAARAGFGYPLPAGLDEAALQARLFPPAAPSRVARPAPDWPTIHRELQKKHVTLDLVWQEYKAAHPEGYRYSAFCHHYRAWLGRLSVSMRQTHRAGEKLFVDYAGTTLAVIDPGSGEIRAAQLFVAVLGASNYTYAEASWSQNLCDWLGAHVRALEFFGGVPEIVVPDNLKSGVKAPSFYEPELNPSYQEWASHYGIAVLPARVRKPKDKAKVEAGVLIASRWIIAALRNRRLFSLEELNRAIAELLERLNARPFKKLPGCRRSAFEQIDRPQLRALPERRYVFAQWMRRRVGIDYHVEVEGHYYSVPYRFARLELDARLAAHTVEFFHKGVRIASHVRSREKGRHSTVEAHLAPAHQAVAGWNAPRLLEWARKLGPHTHAYVEHLMGSRAHPQQAYRACLGVLRLARAYGRARLEAACQRALSIQARSYHSVASILKNGLDRAAEPGAQTSLPLDHANVRGSHYYH